MGSSRFLFETCWDDDNHSSTFSSNSWTLLRADCAARVLHKHDRNSGRMAECNFSFTIPAILRHNLVEWTDCTRNRQERRQTSMLLSGHTSSRKARQYLITKVVHHTSLLTFITSGMPTRSMKKICSKHKRWVLNFTNHSFKLLFNLETFQQNVLQESFWTRSNGLQRTTIRSRTARTGSSRRFPGIG